jgi:hypothetical protein
MALEARVWGLLFGFLVEIIKTQPVKGTVTIRLGFVCFY